MKKYNAKLIRDFVEANKIGIKTVHLGMKEDWRWTNDLLYDADNGGYQFDLGKRHMPYKGAGDYRLIVGNAGHVGALCRRDEIGCTLLLRGWQKIFIGGHSDAHVCRKNDRRHGRRVGGFNR